MRYGVKQIERPVGVIQKELSFNVTVLDTEEKVRNVLSTIPKHWQRVDVLRTINKDTFAPMLVVCYHDPAETLSTGAYFYEANVGDLYTVTEELKENTIATAAG